MRVTCIAGTAGVLVLLGSASAHAQAPAAAPTTIAIAVQRSYNNVKTNVTQSAAKMPDADFGFKVSSAPMTPETRTFGQLFAHIAQSQFGSCAAAKGVPSPIMGRNLEAELKTKDEFVKALADSFAFCDDAYAGLTDANANEMVMQGRGSIARAALLANNVSHSNEMYGTAAAYLRAKNIVPPSTENQQAGRGAAGAGRGAPPTGRQ